MMHRLALFLILSRAAFAAYSSEVHWTICHAKADELLEALDANVDKDKEREVAYLDTTARQWQKEGVTLRVRTSRNKIVTTVKISAAPEKFPTKWLNQSNTKCEWDVRLGQREFICGLDYEVDVESSEEKIFSAAQRHFLSDMSKPVDFTTLKTFGPAENRHLEIEVEGREFEVEEFQYRGQRLLEISQRVADTQSEKTLAGFKKELGDLGVKLCQKQKSKSDWVLELARR